MESNTIVTKSGDFQLDNAETFEVEIIKTNDNDEIFILSDGTFVAKQFDVVDDSVPLIDPVDPDPVPVFEQCDNELYTCNSCNISFKSVTEHVEKYHYDQEVVLEMDEDKIFKTDDDSKRMISTEVVNNSVGLEDENFLNDEITNSEFVVTDAAEKDDYQNLENASESIEEVFYVHIDESSFPTFSSDSKKDDDIESNCVEESSLHQSNEESTSSSKKEKIEKSKYRFKCEICNTILLTNKSLQLHKRMHSKDSSIPRIIEVFSKSGSPLTIDSLKDSAVDGKYYHCLVCDKWIHTDFQLLHNKSHSTKKEYNCEECNKTFDNDVDLKMHMKIHSLEKASPVIVDKGLPYQCNYCNRQFSRPHEKVKHERIHTGEKPYSCTICGKTFRVSYCLTLHMRTHTGDRPYSCAHCGKKFKSCSVYNHHLLTHSDERKYKCEMCPKTFKTAVQLSGHKNSHTKPFTCNECNRPFSSLYAVRSHMLTHKKYNNLKYKCHVCGASYARRFALKDHIEQLHPEAIRSLEFVDIDKEIYIDMEIDL